MYFSKIILLFTLLLSFSCANFGSDLFPSDADLRHLNDGIKVSSSVSDLGLLYSSGATNTIYNATASYRGVVLYFTMWCAVCSSHTSHMLSGVVPAHSDVLFIVVDYVSGTITETHNLAVAGGYLSDFSVVFDQNSTLSNYFNGTMGTTIVIDSSNVVQMIEDYKDGTKLATILAGL